MAQILVRWKDNFHPDPKIDKAGCYKRGYPVVVMPDTHIWGKMECLPDFIIIKIPKVPVEKMQKYLEQWTVFTGLDEDGQPRMETVCRRLWKIRCDDMPLVAINKFKLAGYLTIKATDAYTGTYDFTWTQVKTYFRNLRTELDETGDLV